ncbi:putative MULE transposase domain protein [Blattamonas nauphoetae]|uniref:MULE transposase domain protein n=1 Tax=Blattamonas nauphoetae TaxID=2049346 RepID=A0ABQ9Y0V4_9EUKA|nr:putative MULE transposase domain protein [Blattamonas nauphoetae]
MVQQCVKESISDTITSIRTLAVQHGFGIIIGQQYKITAGLVVIIRCECGGEYKSQKDPSKKGRNGTATKKKNCPFMVKLKGTDATHTLTPTNLTHNHPLSLEPNAWHSSRIQTTEMKNKFETLAKSRTKPMKAQQLLRNEEEKVEIRWKDYANFTQKYWKQKKEGKSDQQLVVEEANEKGWTVAQKNFGDSLSMLFFLPKEAQPYLNTNTLFLAIDTTYKTNMNDYHLVQVVAVSPTYQTIPIAFAFISQETRNVFESVLIELKKFVSVDPKVIITDKDYALRGAIKSVFKDTTILLCTWHATQSVFVKARTLFNHDEATSIEKKMEGIFLEADVQKCETQFTNLISELGEESQMSDYLLTNWWAHKEIVCACYTKQFHRFGTTTTGLCEGQHAALKSFLGTAKYSLSSAFNLIVQHTELRYQRVRTQETTELLNSPTFTRQTRFYGLPCRCQITRFMKNGLPLPLETVHPCWHLQNRDAVTRPPQEVNASQLSDLESTIAEIRAAIIPQPAEDRRTLLEELKTFSSGLRQPSSLKTGTPRKTQSTKRYQTLAERVRSRRIANSPSLLRNS